MRQPPKRSKRFPSEELRRSLENHGLPRPMHEYRKLRTLVYRHRLMQATERKSADDLAKALVTAGGINGIGL